jgi:hypothetical protein
VETALGDLGALPEESQLSVRYEDFVSSPVEQFRRISEFCETSVTDELFKELRLVHPGSAHRWQRDLDAQVLEQVLPIMRPTLERLGYC